MNESLARLSPLHIRLLLHSDVSPETYEPWSKTAKDYLDQLRSLGAVEPEGDNLTIYRTTPLGKAWVTAICDMPPPRMAFLDSNGKEILV